MTAQDKPVAQEPQTPKGTVLFEKKEDGSDAAEKVQASGDKKADGEISPAVSDAERSAPTFVAYDLDAHLTPAKAQLEMHAKLSLRNDGVQPLQRLVMQVSSSLRWERFVISGAKGPVVAAFAQHTVDTDADHTGSAREAAVTLVEPVAPGGVVEVSAFYSGEIGLSAGRLERIGAPALQAANADWDRVSAEGTWLRGFGNVLWYPVAATPVFLGDGAKLFQAVGKAKLREAGATIRLRLTIEYAGDAPKATYFCGRMQPMTAVSEAADAPAENAPGIASVEFPAQRLGFRVPSLFVTEEAPKMAADSSILAATENADALALYGATGGQVQPLLVDWIAEAPENSLTILDHEGQAFEDDALLVTAMKVANAAELSPQLAHSMAHAWFSSSHQWLNEGVAQFMTYLWMERTRGREFTLQQIQQEVIPLAFAEPAAGSGESLIDANDEVYYRTKAAAVLWMLRTVAGEDALKQALRTYAQEERKDDKKDSDAKEFERMLEQTSHKNLNWFFDDWVYRDRGLPDLSIANVTPRELTAKDGRGGWLVAVEVRNAGGAVAEVPVTVRSGTLTATERLRVPGGGTASTRILFQSVPEEVVVNDGSVPEVGTSMHIKQIR